ncbi:MAG: (d)CMP kinase [Spirochaetaceae bacterium]|nr:(d)CMP kinase [Spirochaetaceae bacterium]
MIVAIDGPAGAGKSTIASKVAAKTGFFFLNTGSFYRALTYALIRENISISDKDGVIKAAEKHKIEIINKRIHLDGSDVENFLRSDAVDAIVAQVSAITEVRYKINEQIQKSAQNNNIIAEGRDMTTVVFPNADVKIYLDASIEKRAKRRLDQGTSTKTLEEIKENIETRDNIDQNKEFGKLKISEDAIYLNSSDLTIDEVCDKVVTEINKKAN